MAIKILKINRNDSLFSTIIEEITNIDIKFNRTYIDGFFPTEDAIENYILYYVPDNIGEYVFVKFPEDSNGQIIFYDETGNNINGNSIRFDQETSYRFSVVVKNFSNTLRTGTNIFEKKLTITTSISINSTGSGAIVDYVTRLYQNGNPNNELYNSIEYDTLIPYDISQLSPGDLSVDLDLGVNIYKYNSSTGTIEQQIQNSDDNEY